jgi:hypothetical protein
VGVNIWRSLTASLEIVAGVGGIATVSDDAFVVLVKQ